MGQMRLSKVLSDCFMIGIVRLRQNANNRDFLDRAREARIVN